MQKGVSRRVEKKMTQQREMLKSAGAKRTFNSVENITNFNEQTCFFFSVMRTSSQIYDTGSICITCN
jgi:hypothetical protein